MGQGYELCTILPALSDLALDGAYHVLNLQHRHAIFSGVCAAITKG